MKIAICGGIGCGKSYVAQYLKDKYDFKILSFGGKVKDIAYDLFGLKHKNRQVIQDVAEKMKEIDPDIWIKYIQNKIDLHTNLNDNIVIDDLRFPNEYENLINNDFCIIRINITDDFQKERIVMKYEKNSEIHMKRLNHVSESYYKNFECSYNFELTKDNESDIYNFIDYIIKN